MQLLPTTHRCNNISQQTAVYAVGQPVLLGLSVADANSEPTFVTLKIGGNTISSLECCRVNYNGSKIDVIDVAPFVRAYFQNNETPITSASVGAFLAVNIDIANSGESTTPERIKAYFLLNAVERGKSPILASAPINETSQQYSGVFTADLSLNDFSTIFLPDIAVKLADATYYATNENTITANKGYRSISSNTQTLNVTKPGTSNPITLGQRKIKRVHVCKTSILVQYVNKYDVFEMFIFDEHNKRTYKTTQGDRVGGNVQNNTVLSLGNIYNTETEETISAGAIISDAEYLEKYKEFAQSRKVFLFVGDITDSAQVTSADYWQEVDVTATTTVNTNKPAQKVSAEFTIKNSFQW